MLRQDVLAELRRRPGTLAWIAINVRARKADVAAALRELEELGLAVRRPHPECGWQSTQERSETNPGTSGTREGPFVGHPCFGEVLPA